MKLRDYAKAFMGGMVGALIMFVIMYILIFRWDLAPFQLPPSAAFLVKLGLPAQPFGLLVHFGYGGSCAAIYVWFFQEKIKIQSAIGFSLLLWTVMMTVYSPIIGWGLFGLNPSPDLPSKLQLSSSTKFIFATLGLHIIYGITMGWMARNWIGSE